MIKLELIDGQLALDGSLVSAKFCGRPRTISLTELEDPKLVRELAEDNNTRAREANAYLTGNARRGLTPVVAIQFYKIERE